jgi:hypothetical protein
MLFTTKTLKGFKLDSLDGEIGGVDDFLFDDAHWTVRYLVARTGNWLTGRQVLISPFALVAAINDEEQIAVDLTRKQIEECPPLSSDMPVSRQYETDYLGYYGWAPYWGGAFAWGAYPYPQPVAVRGMAGVTEREDEERGDPHLRSVTDVTGHHIEASDGEIGHVEDFIIDDETWTIRYMIIDTKNWWPGKKVLISPEWIENISWNEGKVFVNAHRETIKNAPEFKGGSPIGREYEDALHRHYEREGYWTRQDHTVGKP